MYYEEQSSTKSGPIDPDTVVVDLRSDTLTKPTKAMREAMFNAEVGDDVYHEDPTVQNLEKKAARMLGMEAAIFVTSGTMGNLIAVMNHCNERGSEAYCGDASHTFLHEQGGAAQIAGVTLCVLRNKPCGTFDLDELESKLRKDRDHEPISKLLLLENTINGKVLPQSWIQDVVKFAKKHDLKLHMDGARIWNAAVALDVPAADLVRGFDSVTFCLSKGLGAPVGSVLCGTKDFIAKARRVRKVLGGGMRQVGVLAAAGLVAMEETIPVLAEDHKRALYLASAIKNVRSSVFSIDLKSVQTNMVFVEVDKRKISAGEFARRLRQPSDSRTTVKCLALNDSMVRFVLYYDITDSLLQTAIDKIVAVMKEVEAGVSSRG